MAFLKIRAVVALGFGELDSVVYEFCGVFVQVLDAPALQDDFYLNLVDWSSHNVLAVGLGNCVYLWNACSSKVIFSITDFSSVANFDIVEYLWNHKSKPLSFL